jgi:hypothetical protein
MSDGQGGLHSALAVSSLDFSGAVPIALVRRLSS